MRLTASKQEVEQYEALCPREDQAYGKQCVPRYMEASMFNLLQWPSVGHVADYKAKTRRLKDKINKSSTVLSYTFREHLGIREARQLSAVRIQSTKRQTVHEYVLSATLGLGYSTAEIADAQQKYHPPPMKAAIQDDEDYASEYQRQFAPSRYYPKLKSLHQPGPLVPSTEAEKTTAAKVPPRDNNKGKKKVEEPIGVKKAKRAEQSTNATLEKDQRKASNKTNVRTTGRPSNTDKKTNKDKVQGKAEVTMEASKGLSRTRAKEVKKVAETATHTTKLQSYQGQIIKLVEANKSQKHASKTQKKGAENVPDSSKRLTREAKKLTSASKTIEDPK